MKILLEMILNYNAEKIKDIFKGKDNDFSKAVCLNSAAGLIVAEKFKYFLLMVIKNSRKHILWKSLYQHLKIFSK